MSRTHVDGAPQDGAAGEPQEPDRPGRRLLPRPPAGRAARVALVAAGVVVLGGVAAYVAALARYGGAVPPHTTVVGPGGTRVAIGGQSPAEAAERVRAGLEGAATDPLTVRAGEDTLRVDPAAAGLTLDAEATVGEAGTVGNPFAAAAALLGEREVTPVPAVDEAALTEAVAGLAERVGREPVAGRVTFSGGDVETVEPQAGRVLRREPAAAALRKAYLSARGPVRLPVGTNDPAVGADEVDRAVRAFARPAMSGPVTVKVPKRGSFDVGPRALAAHLRMKPVDGTLTPRLDGAGLADTVSGRLSTVEREPRDARLEAGRNGPRVVPGKPGVTVPPPRLRDAVLDVLDEPAPRTATVEPRTEKPGTTTEELRALGLDEELASFTTYHPYAEYRVQNIHRAADYMDDTLVRAGEVFSMNDAVGERTPERGFAKGTIIKGGRYRTAYGGGVSQLATTTFNAYFFAGLEDVEHHPHSWWISRYPVGREATVYWGAKDLRFRNDSGHAVWVDTSYTNESVTVTLYGTKRYDDVRATKSDRYDVTGFETVYDPGPRCVEQGGVKGFDIDVGRLFVQDGEVVRRETFHTDYRPEDRVICEEKPGSD